MEKVRAYAESADRNGILKAVERAVLSAVSNGEIEGNTMMVNIPHIEVLYPQTPKPLPEVMGVVVDTPGGNVEITVNLSEMTDEPG